MKKEIAFFGAGCFWGVQAAFDDTEGVLETEVGYMGGKLQNPSYEDVCSDETGHVEIVKVVFDSGKVSFKELVEKFWQLHNPTEWNRQGPDVGSQYRSVIFYSNPEQQKVALASKAVLEKSKRFSKPIVTLIEPAKPFFKAEEYHQKYLEKKGLKVCH